MALQQGTIISISKTKDEQRVGIAVAGSDDVRTIVHAFDAGAAVKFDISKLKIDQVVEFDDTDGSIRPLKKTRAVPVGSGTGAASHQAKTGTWA